MGESVKMIHVPRYFFQFLQKEKKSKIKKLAEFLAEDDEADTEVKEEVC